MRSPAILDSTLREGEQFAGAFFNLEQRLAIAHLLDAIGVTFIEIPSPGISAEMPGEWISINVTPMASSI